MYFSLFNNWRIHICLTGARCYWGSPVDALAHLNRMWEGHSNPHCAQTQHTPHHHQVKVKVCSTNLSAILIYKSSDFSDVFFFLDVIEMRIIICLSITLQSLLMSSGHWDSRWWTPQTDGPSLCKTRHKCWEKRRRRWSFMIVYFLLDIPRFPFLVLFYFLLSLCLVVFSGLRWGPPPPRS